VEIESKRLKFTRPTKDDLEFCCRLYEMPEMMTFLGGPLSREFNEKRFWSWVNDWQSARRPYLVRKKTDNTPVGMVVIFSSKYKEEPIQEMGWMIDLPFHGQGYGTEAAGTLMQHAIKNEGARVIMCFPGKDNPASNKVPEKLGFKRLGEIEYPWFGRTLISSIWRYEVNV
jgi:RimJ/RimL family protein N-acetyltransferase